MRDRHAPYVRPLFEVNPVELACALVQELVRLHGGTIEVASEPDRGSTFSVWLPLGFAHLPADRVRGPRDLASTAIAAQAFVQEALRWLPDANGDGRSAQPQLIAGDERPQTDRRFAATFGARIVLADDNADMRGYLRELLAPYYAVTSAADGATPSTVAEKPPWAPMFAATSVAVIENDFVPGVIEADTVWTPLR